MQRILFSLLSLPLSIGSLALGAVSPLGNFTPNGTEVTRTFQTTNYATLDIPAENANGLAIPENWQSLAPFISPKLGREELPQKWDWREHNGGTPVKHQGGCGSCWAFGTVAVLEAAIKIKTGQEVSISEQQLVSCRPSFGSCMGGFFALDFYRQRGANYSSDFPYRGFWTWCKPFAPQHEKVQTWAYVGEQNRQPSTEEIKAAVYKYGPVAVTVSASGEFRNYRSGVYNACRNNAINHIVAIVGWDEADKAWIVKNSWGKEWGEEGYIRMLYTDENGTKCNGIGSQAVFAVLP